MARRKGWVYGPEKQSLEWRDPDRGKVFALDLTFYGSSELTGRIECVEVALRSIADKDIPTKDADEDPIAHTEGGAPILAEYFREMQISTKVGNEKRKLAALFRRMAEAQVSTASRRVDARTGKRTPFPAATIQQLREGNRILSKAAESSGASRPRSRVDVALLDLVAQIYTRSFEDGDRDPARAVARSFERPQSTTDKWIRAARKKGKLPETRRGVMKAFEEDKK